MVDTSLNRKYVAKKGGNNDFSPIPEGWYTARVKEVTPWEEVTKSIKVIQRDENGKALVDETGKRVEILEPNCKFYNCRVTLEIVGGDYDGRLIFHNLSTHPNMPFNIPNFLYGIGLEELAASEIQIKTVGKICEIDVYIDEYTKTVQNKETGLDEEQIRKVNKVKNFKEVQNEVTNDQTTNGIDLGL